MLLNLSMRALIKLTAALHTRFSANVENLTLTGTLAINGIGNDFK